jgi:hypothetical protein
MESLKASPNLIIPRDDVEFKNNNIFYVSAIILLSFKIDLSFSLTGTNVKTQINIKVIEILLLL